MDLFSIWLVNTEYGLNLFLMWLVNNKCILNLFSMWLVNMECVFPVMGCDWSILRVFWIWIWLVNTKYFLSVYNVISQYWMYNESIINMIGQTECVISCVNMKGEAIGRLKGQYMRLHYPKWFLWHVMWSFIHRWRHFYEYFRGQNYFLWSS